MNSNDAEAFAKSELEVETFLKKSPRPALQGAVIAGGQRFDFSHGLQPSTAEPVFEIGSIGKTFTATLLALMVREGIVSLEDPVSRFRPAYAFGKEVSLRDLACHAAGLPSNPLPIHRVLFQGNQQLAAFSKADLEQFLARRFSKQPKTGKFNYSNPGMALLGHVLGECLGMPYERAIKTWILDPLDMSETRIEPGSYDAQRLLDGHDARGRRVPPFTWPGLEPAGLWRSTVSDMLRFLSAMMGLSDEHWHKVGTRMIQPQVTAGSDLKIGLGWMLSELEGSGKLAWHNGGTFGQHAVAGWLPKHRIAVVILSNRRPPMWHHWFAARRMENLAFRLLSQAAIASACSASPEICQTRRRGGQ